MVDVSVRELAVALDFIYDSRIHTLMVCAGELKTALIYYFDPRYYYLLLFFLWVCRHLQTQFYLNKKKILIISPFIYKCM